VSALVRSQGEGGPPGDAQNGPALDPVELAQRLSDEMAGGIGAEVGIRGTREGFASLTRADRRAPGGRRSGGQRF
jgi:hypothetical protein